MKKLSVSIIIPTLNRKDVLKEALLSLNGIIYPRKLLEVIVVSDGSTDGTNTEIKRIVNQLNYKFKFIKERGRGISHAKNVAIKNSRGKIIISTDDDCLFEKNWLNKLTKPLYKKEVGSVGGPDRAIKKENALAKSIDFAFSSFIGSGGIHGRFLKVKFGKTYPPGCNMAFKKEVVKKIGYFDESLAPGEDTDYNHRIEKAGYKIRHVPNAFVWHRPRNSIARFIPYVFKRGKARVEIIRRHPEYSELIYYLPAFMVILGTALVILSFFSPLFIKILGILFFTYIVILLSAGLSAFRIYNKLIYIVLVPPLIFCQHFFHGIGFIKGSLSLIIQRLYKHQSLNSLKRTN